MEVLNQKPRDSKGSRIVVGLIFLTIGVILFASRLNIIPFNLNYYIFTWQGLLIGIGLILMANRHSRVTGLILIAIGGLYLVADIMGFQLTARVFLWPTIFIAIGLILIFHGRNHHYSHRIKKGVISMDVIDDVVIFGGNEQKNTSRNFQGGNLVNIFGGSTFDLTEAELAPGKNVMNLFCMFGGSKFIIPPTWTVKIEVVSIFGGCVDKRRKIQQTYEAENTKELVFKGFVMFGGGEIKSY